MPKPSPQRMPFARPMLRLLWLAPMLIASCLGSRSQRAGSEPLMPAWFWDAPQDAFTAVGYASGYYFEESSREEAFLDGAWRLFSDRSALVRSDRAMTQAAGQVMQMGAAVRLEVDSAAFKGFLRAVVALDSFNLPGLQIMLVGTSVLEGLDRRLRSSPSSDAIREGDRPIGSGSAPAFYQPSSSWRAAEANARLELALSRAGVRSVSRSGDAGRQSATVLSTNVRLREVQTVRRRYNPATGVYLVWASGVVEAAKPEP